MTEPLRVVQVGAGAMGKAWLRTLARSADVELVGIVDLDPAVARRHADETGHLDVPIATDLDQLPTRPRAQAVINATVPQAHEPVNTRALDGGLDVLCEKPLSESLPECLSMAAAAERTGRLLMVSQSRRYFRDLDAIRAQLVSFGRPFMINCQFSKSVSFGGFRAVMPYPVLVDMAIHQFDLARDLAGSEPVAVICDSYDPPWSPYAGDATTIATFRFANGSRFTFTGSWCSPGFETSWNGIWRLSSQGGTIRWDGDHPPVAQAADGSEPVPPRSEAPEEIAGSLAEFVAAVRQRSVPSGEVHANLISVAMVRAAIAAAERGHWVSIAEVLDEAYAVAVASEQRPDLRDILRGWGSAASHLGLRSAKAPQVPQSRTRGKDEQF